MAERSRVALEQVNEYRRKGQNSDTICLNMSGGGPGTECYDRERGTRSFELACPSKRIPKRLFTLRPHAASHYELAAIP